MLGPYFKIILITEKNKKADFLINTDQKKIEVHKEVKKIIKTLRKKND